MRTPILSVKPRYLAVLDVGWTRLELCFRNVKLRVNSRSFQPEPFPSSPLILSPTGFTLGELMSHPIADIDQIRDLLRDLENLLGLHGSFRPSRPDVGPEPLDSPEQMETLLRELLVEVFGMEVRGL